MSTSGVSDLQARQLRSAVGKLMRPTGVIAETYPRTNWMSSQSALASQRESLFGIWLETGDVVTNITFCSGTQAAVTPTNQWFTLRSAARAKLGVTADDTTTAWAANSVKTLALASPYTVTATGMYYVGIMVKAGTVPNLMGVLVVAALAGLAPISAGHDTTNTTLTDPASAPATSAALTAAGILPYAHIS